jgi:hypothetical protein
MKETHKELQDVALRWLYSRNCSVLAKEVPTRNGVADALGIHTISGKERVYYVEAKASRSDLICAKQKLVYRNAVGDVEKWCWEHDPTMYRSMFEGQDRSKGWETCSRCIEEKKATGDTGIDFYYIIVAEGMEVEATLYPHFGVINHKGEVIRKAKRMKREGDIQQLLINTAHVLVYKAYGKLYIGEPIPTT